MMRLLILPVLMLSLALALSAFDNSDSATTKSTAEISYPEHLTGAFTGGFGEETCRSCHFDYNLNPDGGKLSVSGIPEKIAAGETVEIRITVERKKLGAAGFQLSSRYADGSQAGRFNIGENNQIMFTEATANSLQYVQHTHEGTKPSKENQHSWIVEWQAPESPKGPVIVNIAANAANGDQSEFGDFIYTEEVKAELEF